MRLIVQFSALLFTETVNIVKQLLLECMPWPSYTLEELFTNGYGAINADILGV